jgi:hypothetical protein
MGTTQCNACGEEITASQIADPAIHNTGGDTICLRCHRECVGLEVEVGHPASIPGARWCRPVGWSPQNVIDGAEWFDGDGSWQDENGDAAGIVIFDIGREGDRVTVGLNDLRVASCGDCRVVGEVIVDFE